MKVVSLPIVPNCEDAVVVFDRPALPLRTLSDAAFRSTAADYDATAQSLVGLMRNQLPTSLYDRVLRLLLKFEAEAAPPERKRVLGEAVAVFEARLEWEHNRLASVRRRTEESAR